jgi:uncharacterized protein YbjT (DUF2867 family)/membrane protease YdiL (CAAX protease family)
VSGAVSGPVLVAGATGFVGRRLCAALVDAGYDVRAMTRHPDTYEGPGAATFGDVQDPGSLAGGLEGCRAAYYLVHSLDSKDFERLDRAAAQAFATAAAEAGVRQVVYLGGLGDEGDRLSRHLRSRREVEGLLGSHGVPVTVLRAGIVIGAGGISWEITRQLVDHLPAMVTPRWVRTRTQPVAVDDVVRYLVGVLDRPDAVGRVFEVGGPEVLEYRTMLHRVARIRGRRLFLLPVPLLSPRLSALWLGLVTDVDVQAGRSLVDSMSNEVVVRDPAIREVVPFEPMGYDDAVRAALQEREGSARSASWLARGREAILGRLPGPLTRESRVRHDDGPEVASRRRRVVAGTAVLGAGLLGVSLAARPDSRRFYVLTLATAATWVAGSVASGPLHLGWVEGRDRRLRRPLLTPVATGVGAFGFFYGCALLVRRVPVLDRAVGRVLTFAEEGSTPLVLLTAAANGVGEEVFFRGALYDAMPPRHAALLSTGVYGVATVATRNPALVLAAGVMGSLFALQRRASGGVQAPLLTHLTWSTLMIRFLPPLFRRGGAVTGRAVIGRAAAR